MLMLSGIASVLLHHERADPELAIVVLLNGLGGRQCVPVQERARRGGEDAERHRPWPVRERGALCSVPNYVHVRRGYDAPLTVGQLARAKSPELELYIKDNAPWGPTAPKEKRLALALK